MVTKMAAHQPLPAKSKALFLIRIATADDAPQVHSIYSPIVRDTAISFEHDPPSVDEMGKRIAETLELLPWLVCEKDGNIAGYAYAARHRKRESYQWAAEVSLFVGEKHRRAGVGKALYTALLQILRLQGYFHAFAIITMPNPASVALHESMGFRRCGTYEKVGHKLGRWHDTGWWHLKLQGLSQNPLPPRPFPAVRKTAQAWLDRANQALSPK